MQEALLHYVWQHQHFSKGELQTADGLPINIINPGFLNKDAGPDFSQAKVIIGEIEWNGSIEIHVKASDWQLHKHQQDKAYDNVILHVVWEANQDVFRTDNTKIPVLELASRVKIDLLKKYNELVSNTTNSLPCESQFTAVKRISKYLMLDSLAMERLESKSKVVNETLAATTNDWEQTAYRLLMKSVGLKANAEIFELLATYLPFRLLQKHNDSLFQLECLLFGVAGFLDGTECEYQRKLKEEFEFLSHKYGLERRIEQSQWKFMRLRPAAFPTVRLAQLASLFNSLHSIFDSFTQFEQADQFRKKLKTQPSEYWQSHYNFNKLSKTETRGFGDATIDLIIINAVVPLLVAYGKQVDNQSYIDKAVLLLENTKPESNSITNRFKEVNLRAKSALDSQGMIQWFNEYCNKRRCLECNVGMEILKTK